MTTTHQGLGARVAVLERHQRHLRFFVGMLAVCALAVASIAAVQRTPRQVDAERIVLHGPDSLGCAILMLVARNRLHIQIAGTVRARDCSRESRFAPVESAALELAGGVEAELLLTTASRRSALSSWSAALAPMTCVTRWRVTG